MKKRQYCIDYYDSVWDDACAMMIDPRYSEESKIIQPNEVIIKAHTITIEYDYPLSTTVRFQHTNKKGWTRRRLFKAIQKDYLRIYREEDEDDGPTDNIPLLLGNDGMLNRGFSDGRYGIWGHDLKDLCLEGLTYDPSEKLVTLIIGS
jgi:hypothetical protein